MVDIITPKQGQIFYKLSPISVSSPFISNKLANLKIKKMGKILKLKLFKLADSFCTNFRSLITTRVTD